MVLWGVYGIFMVYFITFVYSLSAPWRVYLHKKISDSWDLYGVFMGFSIFHRILEADGTRFMNIWSYRVSMGFLWCISQLLCIASLHHGECTYIKNFQIRGFLYGFIAQCDLSPHLSYAIRAISSPLLHRVYRTRYARALTSRCKTGLLSARIGVTAGLG